MRENTIDPIAHTHATPADHGGDGPPPRSWLDKGIARLVALGIAGVLAALLVLSLGDDVMALAGFSEEGEETEQLAEDPAIASCIDERRTHVASLRQDGLLSDAQADDWIARATALCRDTPQSSPGNSVRL